MLSKDLLNLPEGEHIVIEERNGLIEALHKAHVAVVDRDGKVLYSSGNPHHFTYTRSCIKPIQALPVLYLGAADEFDFTEQEVAMCAASHSGEAEHIKIIQSMMDKIGITEEDLRCGGHPPFHKETAKELKGDYSKIHDNCSGKHTGAVAICKKMGWDTTRYTSLDHPLTKEIIKLISELVSIDGSKIYLGADGCDIPNFAIPISKMAQLFSILADPKNTKYEKDLKRMRDGFIKNPHLIAGTDRFDTIMMRDHPKKLLSKAGAAGLQTMAAEIDGEWLGITVKIEDGSYPACEVLSFRILKELGVFNEKGGGLKYDPKNIKTRSKQKAGSIIALGGLSGKIDRKTESF
jgi:L-asparaginase II